jgi:hypothetical protein
MTTTKRHYLGEYKVYVDGILVGNISKNGNDKGEWISFDVNGEWISTTPTKWEALTNY